ncbi:MAG: hypothetical protein MJZ17_07385 [Bacteroidales bacterium]|nr:hypothetical protein [Bacteroidales bacterium]
MSKAVIYARVSSTGDRQDIETQTELGFYILNRCYSVMFRIGAAVELRRLGYRSLLLAD